MEHTCGKQCPHCCRNRLESELEIIVPVSCIHEEALSVLVNDIQQLAGVQRVEADADKSCLRIWGDDREVSMEQVTELIANRGCRLEQGMS